MPEVLWVFFDIRDHGAHLFENRWLRFVINIALQQFQNVQPITLIADEIREQYIQIWKIYGSKTIYLHLVYHFLTRSKTI